MRLFHSLAARHRKSILFSILLNGIVGYGAVFLAGCYLAVHWDYDRWVPQHEQVFAVQFASSNVVGEKTALALAPDRLVPFLNATTIAGVEQVAYARRLRFAGRIAEHRLSGDLLYANPAFFSWFLPSSASLAPDEILMRKSILSAAQVSSSGGQYATIDGRAFRVAGEIGALSPTHLAMDAVASVEALPLQWTLGYTESRERSEWNNFGTYCYLRLNAGANPRDVEKSITIALDAYMPTITNDAGRPTRFSETFLPLRLVNVVNLHTTTDAIWPLKPAVPARDLQGIALLAALILLIVTLTHAAQGHILNHFRTTELALRELFGRSARALCGAEAGRHFALFSLTALMGIAAALYILPGVVDAETATSLIPEFTGWPAGRYAKVGVVAVLLGCGTAAALVGLRQLRTRLDRLNDVGATFSRTTKLIHDAAFGMQCALFAFTLVLLIAVATVYGRAASRQLGFDPTNIIAVTEPADTAALRGRMESIQHQLASAPGLMNTTLLSDLPGRPLYRTRTFKAKGAGNTLGAKAKLLSVRPGFEQVLGAEALAGRFFSDAFPGDESREVEAERARRGSAIISAGLAQQLGFAKPEAAIGEQIAVVDAPIELKIVGVVADWLYEGPLTPATPLVIVWEDGEQAFVAARFERGVPDKASRARTALGLSSEDSSKEFTSLPAVWAEQLQPLRTNLRYCLGFAVVALLLVTVGMSSYLKVTAYATARTITLLQIYVPSLPHLLWRGWQSTYVSAIAGLSIGLTLGLLVAAMWAKDGKGGGFPVLAVVLGTLSVLLLLLGGVTTYVLVLTRRSEPSALLRAV